MFLFINPITRAAKRNCRPPVKIYCWVPSPSVCKKVLMLILFGKVQTSQYMCLPRNSPAPSHVDLLHETCMNVYLK